jgi:thioredoxin-related protein
MKRFIVAVAMLPFAVLMMAFINPIAPKVKFVTSDWTAAQTKAKTEKKLFFVDFDASYCSSCRHMDETTYQESGLSSYIEQNVVALRLDVQDFEGITWSQKYEVEALPTMLIFNEQGKLVRKIEGYKSAKDLLAAFKEASLNTGQTISPAGKTTTIAPAKSDSKPSGLNPVTTQKSTSTSTGNTVKTAEIDLLKEKSNAPSGKGLYELNIRRAPSSGHSVQLGVFSSYEILMEQAEKVSKKFGAQKLMLHLDETSGQLVFKLLIGCFNDKVEATNLRETLKAAGFDGIIKDLSTLK